MKITQDALKQLIKEVYKTDMLQEQEAITVQKQLEYLVGRISEGDQERLDLRTEIEELQRIQKILIDHMRYNRRKEARSRNNVDLKDRK